MKSYDLTGANSYRVTQAMQQASRPSAARAFWNWVMRLGPLRKITCINGNGNRVNARRRKRRLRSYLHCD